MKNAFGTVVYLVAYELRSMGRYSLRTGGVVVNCTTSPFSVLLITRKNYPLQLPTYLESGYLSTGPGQGTIKKTVVGVDMVLFVAAKCNLHLDHFLGRKRGPTRSRAHLYAQQWQRQIENNGGEVSS